MKYKSFFILVLTLYSCNFAVQKESNIEEVLDICNSTTNELGFVSQSFVSQHNNMLNIKIHFIENYPLMEESHQVLNSYLFMKLDTLITTFDTITIERTYEDLIGEYLLSYSKDEVFGIQQAAKGNYIFQQLTVFIFNSLNNNELIGFEELVKQLRMLVPDNFEHKKGFWLLLYNYSISCCDSLSEPYMSMKMLQKASHYPEAKWRPDVIDSIISVCEKSCK